jgi:hypothetical protein
MKAKRFTSPNHVCLQCGGQYSRSWVLKRHLLTQHLGVPLQQSARVSVKQNNATLYPSPFNLNQITMMLIMMKQEIDRISARQSTIQSVQNHDTAEDPLAVALQKLLQQSSMQQALRASQDSWMYIEKNFFLIPKSIVMGFSSFVCPRCLSADPPLPIKDIGVDFTALTKHICKPEKIQAHERHRIPDLALALKQLKQCIANTTMALVDGWGDGTKQIIAKKINPKLDEGISIEDYLRGNYGVPYRYYIAEPVSVDRFPWLNKLLDNRYAIPTRDELRDYCTWCNGTYAVVPVIRDNIKVYYNMILITPSMEEIISRLEK